MKNFVPFGVLVLVVGLIFWSNKPNVPTLEIDPFEVYQMEGFFSAVANEPQPNVVQEIVEPTPEPVVAPIPEPIVEPIVEPTTVEPVEPIKEEENDNMDVVKQKRILYFGNKKTCPWCIKTQKEVFPEMNNKGWTTGPENTNWVQVLDENNEEDKKLFNKYNIDGYPTYIILESEKETKRHKGFMLAGEITDLFYNKDKHVEFPVYQLVW